MTLQATDYTDNAALVFFLEYQNAHFIQDEEKLYLQGNMSGLADTKDGCAFATMYLYDLD